VTTAGYGGGAPAGHVGSGIGPAIADVGAIETSSGT